MYNYTSRYTKKKRHKKLQQTTLSSLETLVFANHHVHKLTTLYNYTLVTNQ
jgi:hypothetical protein